MSEVWSEWKGINAAISVKGPACYQTRFVVDGVVSAIPRWWQVDANGILSIGTSRNLNKRIRGFRRGLVKGRGHSSANRLCRLKECDRFASSYPIYAVEVRYLEFETENEAKRKESELLGLYELEFGELPPLNSNKP